MVFKTFALMEDKESANDQSNEDTEITNDTPIDDIINDIENATGKKKRKARKKKNKNKKKGTAKTQQSEDEKFEIEVVEQIVDEEEELNSIKPLDDVNVSRTVSESTMMTNEGEEKKGDIMLKPIKEIRHKKPVKSAKKNKKDESVFKLEKLEIGEGFWEAYESDATSGSDAESFKEYTKDGYHPVHVGETFNNRYRILK